MISRRPPERRVPRVTLSHDLPVESEPVRSSDPATASAAERFSDAIDVAARRRLRRLQKAAETNTIPPPVVIPQGLSLHVRFNARWLSALIVVALGVVLYIFLTNNVFFIQKIYVGGTHYLTPQEIFARSDLVRREGPLHIFWVDPAEVEKILEADPSVANATVRVGWPPNLVQITITEREPALIWVQAGQRVWIDISGRVMALRQDLPNLVSVIVEKPSKDIHLGQCLRQGTEELLGPQDCIDQATVSGILQFKSLYPNVTEMVYDPVNGLGYHDGRGWVLWFGDGVDLATKMAVYNRIVEDAQATGKHLIEVNVADPDVPYISMAPSTQ